jgi:dolichol-phosphate mannosyltransferase
MAVGSVIERIPMEALRRSGYDVYVWVVDGRSVDATPEVAKERGASIYVQSGAGKGNGVRQALDHLMNDRSRHHIAAPRVYVMLDADGTYPPEAIPEFVEALESGCDVVAGSRLRGHIEDGALTSLNRLGNEVLSGLAAFLFGFPITDVCTGMWAFREDCLQRFRLAAETFDLEADIFASACEVGARLRELPVDYACRIGEAKLIPLRTGLLIAWRLLMKRLNAGDLDGAEGRDVPTQAGRAADQ